MSRAEWRARLRRSCERSVRSGSGLSHPVALATRESRRWFYVACGDRMPAPGWTAVTIAAWLALMSRGVRDYGHAHTRDRRHHHRGVTGPPRRRLAPRAARRGARRDPGAGIPPPSDARGVLLLPRQGARRTGRVAAADQSGGYRPLASHPRPAGRVRRPKTAG